VEDFDRDKTPQLTDTQRLDTLTNGFKFDSVIEREREVALDGGEARQCLVADLSQVVLVESVEEDFSDEDILT